MVTNSGISNVITGFTGVNSAQLVNDLVTAQLEPKQSDVRERQNLNQARISALASASSALETFSKALSEVLNGRQLTGNLVSTRGDLVAPASSPDRSRRACLPPCRSASLPRRRAWSRRAAMPAPARRLAKDR